MSGMDGRAFGSPVAVATVATNACGSVGERVVRGSRIRLFHDGRESMQRSMQGRTFLFRLLEGRTLNSKMKTQATETPVTHPIVRKVPVQHEACPH
jgi:hypothetical protein